MKNILLIIIALTVGFGAFIVFSNKSTNTPSSTNQPTATQSQQTTPAAMNEASQTTSVILGDAGFEPKDITIKAGTKVVWVNKSGKAATVNSDDHPTHSLYPFLNLGEFPSSSSLEVVFDKAGKYTYHNHLNASDTGTVTVE